ncbi:MAG: DUF4248 domain-containing protein [Tannerellaceae bacterium]|nr:DUF4248 domain-containing protein [Tannerellaceae bacterium]
MEEFIIKSYSWKELAILYAPELTSNSAARRFKKWVNFNQELVRELVSAGWRERSKVLTPMQVEIIVRYLGEP